MRKFEDLLSGGDLRSIGKSNSVVALIENQAQFSELFLLLFHQQHTIVMRAADSVEKITINHPEYLHPHKKQLRIKN
jgi:hypothetical protein